MENVVLYDFFVITVAFDLQNVTSTCPDEVYLAVQYLHSSTDTAIQLYKLSMYI